MFVNLLASSILNLPGDHTLTPVRGVVSRSSYVCHTPTAEAKDLTKQLVTLALGDTVNGQIHPTGGDA